MRGDQRGKADINISTSGDNTIITAPGAGKHIEIDFMVLFPASAVNIQLKDGTTSYGGSLPFDAKQVLTLDNTVDYNPPIDLSDNSAFVVNLDGNVQTSGWVKYRIVG